jgi:urease subunit gamma
LTTTETVAPLQAVKNETRHGITIAPLAAAVRQMQLTPRETEKLLVYVAADLARRRRERGLKLNLPEATALITEAMLEGARDGRRVSEVRALGRRVLTRDDVMDEVPDLLTVVHVEATFPDGTKLVSCHDPIP